MELSPTMLTVLLSPALLFPFIIFLDYFKKRHILRNLLWIASLHSFLIFWVKFGTLWLALYLLVGFWVWMISKAIPPKNPSRT
ncbi:MAG: hypothetical protein ACK5W1_06700 [Flavobacteriales bacterium]